MTRSLPVIVILGPTASGKTRIAVRCAEKYDGEVISADSRQVYRGLDIGTGKDLQEFGGIRHHLIDIVEPGEPFNLKLFQYHAYKAIDEIEKVSKLPFICGGTALYLDSILNKYDIPAVKPDLEMRAQLELSEEKLYERAKKAGISNFEKIQKRKLIRKIEVIDNIKAGPDIPDIKHPEARYLTIGVRSERAVQKSRITKRLDERIERGMLQEVDSLLEKGVSREWLRSLGLEYKWSIGYLEKRYSFDFFFKGLRADIIAFSKRQNSWFRRMEKKGLEINWIFPGESQKAIGLISFFLNK
ncbi:tRNA (adenosine(37)-N6)-dimethylallyltransferase MiaA [candidate division WOR-3 bacterium]|nr:tRNA (adenosine(37)-N6)-dimethylallyltransferase MiaA [candidate division WOR-3 bacterium]